MIMQKSGRSNSVRFGLLVSAFLILVSCGNSRKTYVLTGRIISKLPSKQLLIINNDDIPVKFIVDDDSGEVTFTLKK